MGSKKGLARRPVEGRNMVSQRARPPTRLTPAGRRAKLSKLAIGGALLRIFIFRDLNSQGVIAKGVFYLEKSLESLKILLVMLRFFFVFDAVGPLSNL